MERLTFEGNFCDIARCGYQTCPYKDGCSQKQVWERLKAYEDTGLSPIACEESAKIEKGLSEGGYSISRMVELMCADKEGRVVVLPCRGDDDIVLMRNGVAFKPDHWNIYLTTFAENQPTPSGKKVALFDLREVRELMEGKKDG